jgi:hypothetical protein
VTLVLAAAAAALVAAVIQRTWPDLTGGYR